MRQRELRVKALVDITRIPGLDEIRAEDPAIQIGALATHSQIIQSPLIQENVFCLCQALSPLGSPQIPNLVKGGSV